MRHPIDDYFKNKLGALSDDVGMSEDWKGAKVLLGFKERKKRRFLWIWGMASVLFLSTLFILRNPRSSVHIDSLNSIEDSALSNKPKTEGAIIKEDVQQSKNDVETAQSSLEKEVDFKTLLHDEKSFTTKNVANDNRISDQSKIHRQSLTHIELTAASDENDQNVHIENSKSNVIQHSLDAIASNKTANNQPIVIENDELSTLNPLTISPLNSKKTVISTPKLEKVVEIESETSNLALGMYTTYNFRDRSPSIGLFSNINLKSRFSVDLGVGISRFTHNENNAEEELALDNQRGLFGQLTSQNSYKYFSLNLPIHLNFHQGNTFYFLGVMIERPFTLSGNQTALLDPEFMDSADLPPPTGGPPIGVSSEPVMSALQYNLSSVPDLNRFFVYTRIGIGRELSKQMRLMAQFQYRLNEKRMISPLVGNVVLERVKSEGWELGIRLDYRF